jgi:hypothetical protein
MWLPWKLLLLLLLQQWRPRQWRLGNLLLLLGEPPCICCAGLLLLNSSPVSVAHWWKHQCILLLQLLLVLLGHLVSLHRLLLVLRRNSACISSTPAHRLQRQPPFVPASRCCGRCTLHNSRCGSSGGSRCCRVLVLLQSDTARVLGLWVCVCCPLLLACLMLQLQGGLQGLLLLLGIGWL